MENQDNKYAMQIQPLVERIKILCNEMGIPCFMAFGTSQDENKKFNIKCTTLLPQLFGEDTPDRRFVDFVNIQNGFEAVIPHEFTEFADLSEEKIQGEKIDKSTTHD